MLFGDLAAEHEADPSAVGFGREEGDEEIGVTGEIGAVVFNDDLYMGVMFFPADRVGGFVGIIVVCFQCGLCGIGAQVVSQSGAR